MESDNGRSLEAQKVRQESEFIKRVEDFARYMAPEYITDGDHPRSLCIIAADCLDAKRGRHAMAHILIGDNHVGRCALRSMMEENDAFAEHVHELCDDDGGDRSVEELDVEIGRKKRRMTISIWSAVAVAAWSVVVIVLQALGIGHWAATVSSLLLMAWCGILVGMDIKSVRRDIARLRQQRKRAAGRRKIMGRMAQFGELLRQLRSQIEEDADDDD